MCTRSALPPMLTRGIMRSVWLANAAPSAGAGAAVQVPTQCVLSLMVPLYIVRASFVACAAACSRLRHLGHVHEERIWADVRPALHERVITSRPRPRPDASSLDRPRSSAGA